MADGSVAEVAFDGRDRDLRLELLDSSGTVLSTYDTRETGPESVVVIAPAPGSYVLRVASVEQRVRATPYTLRVRMRARAPQDEDRVAAQTASTEARKLATRDGRASHNAALAAFQGAAVLWRKLGDSESEAAALIGAGTALHYLAQHEQAAATFTNALELLEGTGAEWVTAECLNNLGISLWQGGNFPAAIERYLQSLAKLRQIGHRRGQAAALSNLGIVHREIGEYDKARQYHAEALPITIEVSEPAAEAYVRSNLGVVLAFLGQRTAAIVSLTRAQKLFHGMPNSVRAEGRAWLHLASIQYAARRYKTAAAHIQPALRLIEQSGDRRSLGDATMLQARLLAVSGQTREAAAALQRAASIYSTARMTGGEASVLHAQGELAAQAKDYAKAVDHFEKALAIRRGLGVRDAIAETLYRLAAVRRATGDLKQARDGIQEALQLTEEVRTLVSGPQYRMSYLSSKHDYYELAVNIDIDLHRKSAGSGYHRSAFELSERARTRTLLDTLNANYQTPAVQALRSRIRALTASLRFWSFRLSEQAASGASADRLAGTRARVDNVLAEYRNLQSDIGSASRVPPEAVSGPLSLDRVQETLNGTTSLLQYFVGEERSAGWLITRRSLEMSVLPGRAAIERLARQYSSALRSGNPAQVYEKAARALAKAILPPRLRPTGPGRLLIAPDDVLHQIPMPLLPGGNGAPLLFNHEVAAVPSVSSVAAQRAVRPATRPADGTLAVVADPVFDAGDRRVRTASSRPRAPRFPRLGYTSREAKAIAALVPESKRTLKLGFQANPDVFLNGEITRHRNVHVATHTMIDEAYPEFSSLVLSMVDQSGRSVDGYLRAADIETLTVRADLVTLSACATGLGARIRGEGPLSLARAFLNAGARMVLVSLWNVPDDATAELMTAFYRRLLAPSPIRPAIAFREAQMELQSRPGREHPFYWAGWVLTGDWQ